MTSDLSISAILDAKRTLRRDMRARLEGRDGCATTAASVQMVARFQSQPAWYHSSSVIALFGGLAGEPELLPLIPWLAARGVTPVLFGFHNGELIPQAVRVLEELERGPFGVWIPKASCTPINAAALTLILVPGLAFDLQGGRCGRGKGHYDRFFARSDVTAPRIGVAFDDQLVPQVPCEAHDARLQGLLTPSAVHIFG
jgi:5-formyltetrahydrofolate cyclo-ligase